MSKLNKTITLKKNKNKLKDEFIINKKIINYNKEKDEIIIMSINIAGRIEEKIRKINKIIKDKKIDIIVLNEVKINAEDFFKIKKRFRTGKTIFNGRTKEENQREYQTKKEKKISKNEKLNEKQKKLEILKINKQKVKNKGGIIVIINKKIEDNIDLVKNIEKNGITIMTNSKKKEI